MKRPFSVSVTGTNITDERTSKLMRNISKNDVESLLEEYTTKRILRKSHRPFNTAAAAGDCNDDANAENNVD